MPTHTIKAIIVDDERLARNELKKLLEQHPEIEVVDEASNVDEGVEKIDIARPDLYIYLYQNTERLQENIRLRGRDYEQTIESSYLDKINSGYLEFIQKHPEFKVKIIDISNRDFIKNRVDYLWILEQICA